MRYIHMLFVLFLAVALSGCAAVSGVKSGNPESYAYIRDSVVIGKTTINEVREKAGVPNGQEQRGDGSVALTYKASATKSVFGTFSSAFAGESLADMQTATVLFDRGGVAIGVSGTDMTGGKTSSFSRGVPVNAYGMYFQGQPPAPEPQQPAQIAPAATPPASADAQAASAPAPASAVVPAKGKPMPKGKVAPPKPTI